MSRESSILQQKGGRPDASVLYEMPDQERNERPQEHYHEEWQAGNPGNMPNLRDQNVQDREELRLILQLSRFIVEAGLSSKDAQPFDY